MRRTESLAEAAERVLGMVMADPRRARISAVALLASAHAAGDVDALVIAERALGLAARASDDVAGAARQLRRSIKLAESHRLPRRAAESRMSLALVLDDLGRPAAAVREIDRAVASLTGLPRARARMQRAIILRRLGREDEALAAYGDALTVFRRSGDRLWQARALTNRGVLQAYRGTLRAAETDLRRAELLYTELGQQTAIAQVRHNLGFVAAQAGDVPAALDWYDRADEHFRRHGRPAEALLDRAELLFAARLWPEAWQAASAAADASARTRMGSVLPQARLLEAQAALAVGDLAAARTAASYARRVFRRQGRTRWVALADYIGWRAQIAGKPPTPALLAAARPLAVALAQAGWAVPALEARLRIVEAGVVGSTQNGEPAVRKVASQAIEELAAAVATIPRGPARLRARAWYGRALVRLHAGDRAGAKRALIAGLRVVDAHRASFGATELRVHSSAEGAHTAALGLRLAVSDGQPREVLTWAERSRAAVLRLAPPPPPSPALTAELAQLRRVSTELSTMDLDPARMARLLRRQRVLEDSVRQRTWRTPGAATAISPGRSVDAITSALAGRALLELVEVGGSLSAVVAVSGRLWLRPLADVARVDQEMAALRFALRRLAMRRGGESSLSSARASAAHATTELDSMLLGGVRDLIGERPLVIVPTGSLHGLPWPILPTCRGRALTVAPSAGLWREAAASASGLTTMDGSALLVAPPQPTHAIGEVLAIGRYLPDATVLVGSQARAPQVLSAMDGMTIAHLATHGVFRADNPLFSYLSLVDGPLTVYDLMHVRRPPSLVVLSACDAGLSTVYEGDELMGFVSAVLGLGTRTLIASVGPVDDEAASALMVDLHRRLREGAGPAEALAAAQAGASVDAFASTYNLVCFGAG